MVVVRTEEPDDAEAIADVHVRAWQAGYAGIMPADVLAGLDPVLWARRRRARWASGANVPFTTLVAQADGVLAGFTTIGPYRNQQRPDDLDPAYGEILAMYVDPTRWGTGVGRALMTAALADLTGHGWREVRLWVLADNVRARRFYERAGLAFDGESSTYELQQPDGRPALALAEVRYGRQLDRL